MLNLEDDNMSASSFSVVRAKSLSSVFILIVLFFFDMFFSVIFFLFVMGKVFAFFDIERCILLILSTNEVFRSRATMSSVL